MEKAAVMKTFHGSLPPKSPTLRDRDASFSSCLTANEPSDCQRHVTIVGPGLDDPTSELSIFDAHKYFNEVTNNDIPKLTISSSNTRVSPLINMYKEHNPERGDITEISRFSSASSPAADGYANIKNYRARSFCAATPTASSEASWNSQTGLLSHTPEAIPVSMSNSPHPTDPNKNVRASLSKPIWLFRRRCPCSDKKSVEVKEQASESKAQMPLTPRPRPSHNQIARDSLNLKRQELDSNPKTPIDKYAMNMETATNKSDQRPQDHEMFVPKSQRLQPAENQVPTILQSQRLQASVKPFGDGFTFPVLNPQKPQVMDGIDEDPPRDSLEVFQPSDIEPSCVSRKPIDRDSKDFPFPPSPKSRIIDDDVASDASSDLFEIESFSVQTTSTNPIIYGRRDSLDEASNVGAKRLGRSNKGFLFGWRSSQETMTTTETECYEPSEASIDWSETTAEGFDRASSIGNFSVSASEYAEAKRMPEKCKGRSSSGNGSLMSCRCEKAVSVGPQPVKCVPGAKGHEGATASRHVNSRPASVNKPAVVRSQTARMSLALAT